MLIIIIHLYLQRKTNVVSEIRINIKFGFCRKQVSQSKYNLFAKNLEEHIDDELRRKE